MKKLVSMLVLAVMLAGTVCMAEYDENGIPMDAGDVSGVSVFRETETVSTAEDIDIPVPAAVVMEKETGTILYEKDADSQGAIASVTKIMTILLLVEALESELIALDDIVTTSAEAAGMGGSQIFLKEGEQMTVEDILKAIVVSSANDASVAMAEHIAGTEDAFAARMNERASELGMTGTTFLNCTGLPEGDQENMSTARDVAVMSRALIEHSMIKDYTTIWMDSVRNGEFGLSNTNKMIFYYEGATGLKTGFTQSAMYCLSATAERGGVEYIAVVLHGETSDERFSAAKTLLNYAFANYTLADVQTDEVLQPIAVKLGVSDYVQPVLEGSDSLLLRTDVAANITKTVELAEGLTAPVKEGDQVGTLTVYNGEKELARVPIVAGNSVAKVTWKYVFGEFMGLLFTGGL